VFVAKIDYSSTCSYRIGSKSKSVAAPGGSARVEVITKSGCPWTVATDAPWITGTLDTGVGSGVAGFDVASNTGGARSATIKIAGHDFLVRQAAERHR
jgi:hypothetical protein